METKNVYTQKAADFARFRWDYAPEALDTIFRLGQLSEQSSVADIGAGTGILTRHFSGKVRQVYAIEPNAEMRRFARESLDDCSVCVVIDAAAENTTLPDRAVDLIAVAHAIHWFNPEAARMEFRRILKPGGRLAVLRNIGTNESLNLAITDISRAENGFVPPLNLHAREWKPLIFYYGNGRFQRILFPFRIFQSYEHFLGSLLTVPGMPERENALYARLEQSARRVFDRFSVNDMLEVQGITELFIGEVSGVH